MNPAASLRTSRALAPASPAGASDTNWAFDLRAALVGAAQLARQPSRWTKRGWLFATLLLAYLIFTVLVLIPNSPPLRLDLTLADEHFGSRHYSWLPWVKFVVGFGQRWIMTQVLEVIVLIAALRARSLRPAVHFVLAIILLNVSVGVVKYSVGRIGPAHNTDVHKIFQLGGSIYPSGHVSNAVVLYGVMALAIPRFRAWLAGFAVAISVIIGFGTIYLRTHWFSDVIGGWIAGSLVLVALPTLMPWAERFADQLVAWVLPMVRTRPRLHRVASAVRRTAFRLVPPDPNYWPAGRPREAQRPAPAGVAVPAGHSEREFADWPSAERLPSHDLRAACDGAPTNDTRESVTR